MADDDDDDSFGEFTFASNQPTPNSSSQIPATTGDDDDWGDFNFVGNNATDHNLSPQPQPQIQTTPKWEKIKGALPLSLFGGEEEEEEEDKKPVMPVAGNDVKQSSFPGNSGFPSNNNTDKSNANLGINDLISDLYGPRQQQTATKATDNGNGLDSTARSSSVYKDPLSKSESLSSFSFHSVATKAADNGNGLNYTARNSAASKDPFSKSESLSSFSFHSVGASGYHGSDDEGGWEFMDAYSESKLAQNGKDNKERSEKTVSPPSLQDGSHGPNDPFGTPNNGSHRPNDLFGAPSNGVFVESHVTDSGFNSKPITNIQNGFAADTKANSKDTTNELNSNPLGGSVDSFGEFEAAFMEQPSKKKEISDEDDLFSFPNGLNDDSHKEKNNGFDFRQSPVAQNIVSSDSFSQTESNKSKNATVSQPPVEGNENDDENVGKSEISFQEAESKPQGYEPSPKNYKQPVPLSIFGIEEETEVDNSLNLEHELFKSSSSHGKHMRTLSSNLSINDILSDLYNQSEPISSDVVNNNHDDDDDDDNFDDGSWEFKDASSQSKAQNQNLSFKEKLNNFIDLYSNLKDELCFVARHHLHGLKKAQITATLAGEEMKVAALDKQIQEAFEKLHQKDIISTEVNEDDDVALVISLNQYIKTLHEPHFLIFDSEYNISKRLPLAESDLQTAIDLINHITRVLKIIKLAPKGEACNYVTQWFKVIQVCSQELKHATWILNQSLQKNINHQILSQQQGKQFVNAIGEIYRVVVILGAAVKFYKPWILLNGVNLEGLYGLLAECDSLWSTSGLEEVISVDSLSESISHIRDLDEFSIVNLDEEESQCQLSLLSPRIVPEMKMVIWNGETFFVTIANLWANLISPDPPKLT
ncbi:uncharacterized protein LOC111909682 [Lactuca sativa]|uniref:uncharacterized protein LOC111909682 n=1 Tax=Lactuca sativa TaxID=4236 RepID=UPI000CC899D9|nr:uncharacterized protein LOC111909682 [Lactuca sativa]